MFLVRMSILVVQRTLIVHTMLIISTENAQNVINPAQNAQREAKINV